MKYSKSTIEDAKDSLIQRIRPKSTIYTILRHRSRSGMTRRVSAVVLVKEGYLANLSYGVAILTGYIVNADGSEIIIKGTCDDSGVNIVAKLSNALYGNTKSLFHEWI